MTKNNLRLFIAIELGDELRQALAHLQERLKRDMPQKAVRWVRPGAIHLTLKFLGDTPASQVPEVVDALERAAAGFAPFQFMVEGFGCFPNPQRANVLWAGVPAVPKALAGLQLATDLQVARLGYEKEQRPFSPHLTLGRVNRKLSSADRAALTAAISSTQVGRLGTVDVQQVILFQSQLQPAGAIYTALAHVPLSGSP